MDKDVKRLIEESEAFEIGFPDGVYTVPMTKKVKVRSLIEYCQKKGVSIESLGEAEVLQFVEKVEGKSMNNNQDFEDIVKKARKKVWNIVISLLDNKVDIYTIIGILAVERNDLEELQGGKYEVAKRIAINLAEEAHELNLTAKTIEEKTGVRQSEFIKFMKEEG
ncbi:hypothetical protein VBD025_02910 [Virgibacillus flavescens]|uniref:hypothetical protein n=1 Tax=Virgibacillus flavescens TaxID=1611422 RepID=UPI003D333452